MLLRLPKGLGMDDDLMPGVGCYHAIVALDHAMGGDHLGTFIVCDVALFDVPALADFVLMLTQPLLDLPRLGAKVGQMLLFLLLHRSRPILCLVLGSVLLHDVGN